MYTINNVTFVPNGEKVTVKLIDSQWDSTVENARKFYRYQQELIKTPLAEGEEVYYNDHCPQHNNPVKKEYRFGMQDAILFTFKGCKCCVSHTGFPNKPTYHKSYESASGKASMQKALNAVF